MRNADAKCVIEQCVMILMNLQFSICSIQFAVHESRNHAVFNLQFAVFAFAILRSIMSTRMLQKPSRAGSRLSRPRRTRAEGRPTVRTTSRSIRRWLRQVHRCSLGRLDSESHVVAACRGSVRRHCSVVFDLLLLGRRAMRSSRSSGQQLSNGKRDAVVEGPGASGKYLSHAGRESGPQASSRRVRGALYPVFPERDRAPRRLIPRRCRTFRGSTWCFWEWVPTAIRLRCFRIRRRSRRATQIVVANYVEKFKAYRITLTASTINNARNVTFLAAGEDKAETLKNVLEGSLST